VVLLLDSIAFLLELLVFLSKMQLISTLSILILAKNMLQFIKGRILFGLTVFVLAVVLDIHHVLVKSVWRLVPRILMIHYNIVRNAIHQNAFNLIKEE
jgi:hypothetical protein